MHANDVSESISLRYHCIILITIGATLKPTNNVIVLHCHLFLVGISFSLSPESTGN